MWFRSIVIVLLLYQVWAQLLSPRSVSVDTSGSSTAMGRATFLVWVLLTARFLPACADFVASDEHGDVGHDDDVHPNILTETSADGFDVNVHTSMDTRPETRWDGPDSLRNQDDYEDADWHPPPSPLQPLPRRPGSDAANQTGPSAQCGEHSFQLTAGSRCRLEATLPPAGTSPQRCPDVFRCADDVSFWHHETRARKEQLEQLKETTSELQEELRSHRHRVQGLELQGEQRDVDNCGQKLRSLELRHAEADTLLRVHAALLHELQAQLSAAVRHVGRDVGRAPPLSIRNTPPPDGRHLPFCPSDCASLYHSGVRRSGVYAVVLSPGSSLSVYCDMETDGGGWTVLQRRRDGSVSFNRGWAEYRAGFGEARGEHWLGNQAIYLLSNQAQTSLRIDLQDWSHTHRHALFHSFRTDSEENQYRLHVSGFSGTVEDSFGWYHDLQGFSTPDTGNICAEISHSGWWFHQCFQANLNGVYYKGGRYSLKAHNLLGPDGIVWFSWKKSDFYSLKAVTMMVRPRSFRPRVSP
ncbi:fibroleukin-like [Betta splendens]|uniref:Fibroleukin-like n=1 Tax=Betta splendens TaxID=158456 RepID=A0A8M1HK82_BETSP|nr:fibroleukin-like [Betta splendens]